MYTVPASLQTPQQPAPPTAAIAAGTPKRSTMRNRHVSYQRHFENIIRQMHDRGCRHGDRHGEKEHEERQEQCPEPEPGEKGQPGDEK